MEALRLVFGTSGQIPGANNEVREAKTDTTAKIIVGQVFSSVQTKDGGRTDE